MNINKQYAWESTEDCHENTTLSFLGIYEDWLLERVDVGKLQQSSISCFNLAG